MKRQSLLIFAILFALAGSTLAGRSDPYRLGVDDVVRISVYGHPDLELLAQVADNGSINFPNVGEVVIAGLTTREAEQRLARALSQREVVKSPQVNLIIDRYQSQMVTMLGEVANPGVYVITRRSNLMDMVSQAGGLSDEAGGEAIIIHGSGSGETRTRVSLDALIQGDLDAPVPRIVAGDKVFIPRADRFYVYGEVNKPGAYRLEPGMTVMQALAVAGGLTDKGTERGMKIRRPRASGGEEVIPADLTQRVQASDVVQVKESLF